MLLGLRFCDLGLFLLDGTAGFILGIMACASNVHPSLEREEGWSGNGKAWAFSTSQVWLVSLIQGRRVAALGTPPGKTCRAEQNVKHQEAELSGADWSV